jgi:transposase
MFTVRRYSYARKKRGEKVKYQGRKSAKTVNTLVLCDNKYNILAISDGIDGNHHDSFEIVENFQKMIDSMDKQQIDYSFSHLNADSGFDVKVFLKFVEDQKMIPNIKQNKRNTKKKDLKYRYMSEYIYQSRFKVEVVFAWLDTYKRLLVRFEELALNFKSWMAIASAMINFRSVFN